METRRTCTVRRMMPGSAFVPCIVCVFPEEVTPYANMVTVLKRFFSRISSNNEICDTDNTTIHEVEQWLYIINENLLLCRIMAIAAGKSVFFSSLERLYG